MKLYTGDIIKVKTNCGAIFGCTVVDERIIDNKIHKSSICQVYFTKLASSGGCDGADLVMCSDCLRRYSLTVRYVLKEELYELTSLKKRRVLVEKVLF